MFVTSDVLEPRGSIKYASAYATSFDWCRNLELRPSPAWLAYSVVPAIWEAEARGLPVNNLDPVLKVKSRKGKGYSLW